VTASYGVVHLPAEASDPTSALLLADQRMYGHKDGRRASAVSQPRDLLLGVLREREPERIDEIARAAELHDIGKMAIPDAILSKPGPLDADEWEFMRNHTLIGERILGAAPALRSVAKLVRSSHERWDGDGYPDRLAGTDIPLGAAGAAGPPDRRSTVAR
jgi:response regulator RpfG family c-di-GMP phosphodiesterase